MTLVLKDARKHAAARYTALGEQWLKRFDVRLTKTDHKALTGKAWAASRNIIAPWPTSTRWRLYILAHEIGHVTLRHDLGGMPSYAREFEAELFAHKLMRVQGIEVANEMTVRAKSYVSRKITQSLMSRCKRLDPSIVNWADPHHFAFLKDVRADLFARDGKRYFADAKRRTDLALGLEGRQ